jgi:hypothetical protein
LISNKSTLYLDLVWEQPKQANESQLELVFFYLAFENWRFASFGWCQEI